MVMPQSLLFWLPLAAASAHIFEEFAWPGGFAEWYRRYRPEIERSLSPRYLVIVNAALLFGLFSVGVDRRTVIGPAFLLTMVAILFGNGVFHLFASVRTRTYSPGAVTGALFYIPLGVVTFSAILRTHLASLETAIVAAIIGCSYQVLSVANHRRRAKVPPRPRRW